MQKSLAYVRRTFRRQAGELDCGLACVSSLLNYYGRFDDVPCTMKAAGVSLLEMKCLLESRGLHVRAVRMNDEALGTISEPAILHVINEQGLPHFITCYGRRKNRRYIIGDPAFGVKQTGEEELFASWNSRAALVISKPEREKTKAACMPELRWLLRESGCRAMLVAIPVMGLIATAVGILIMAAVQKTASSVLPVQVSFPFIAGTFLIVILGFRSMLLYARQQAISKIEIRLNELLASLAFSALKGDAASIFYSKGKGVRSLLGDIAVIQSAFLTFLTGIAGEGLILVLLLGFLAYSMPSIFAVSLLYVLIIWQISRRMVPEVLQRRIIYTKMVSRAESLIGTEDGDQKCEEEYSRCRNYASGLADYTARVSLIADVPGALLFCLSILILTNAVGEKIITRDTAMTAGTVVFFITIILRRIQAAIIPIAEGIAVLKKDYRIFKTGAIPEA